MSKVNPFQLTQKKILPALFFISVLLLCTAQAAGATGNTSVSVGSVYEVRRNAEVTVAVWLANSAGMMAGELEIEFDPKAISLVEVTKGSILDGFIYTANEHQAKEGIFSCSWAKESGITDNGNIIKLTFKLLQKNASSEIAIKNCKLYDEHYNRINVTLVNGAVSPFNGLQKEPAENTPANKEWTIVFNRAINTATANKQTIFVAHDVSGERIDVIIEPSDDRKSVTVKPVGWYAPGSYTLHITRFVRAVGDTSLKQPVCLQFTVDDQ